MSVVNTVCITSGERYRKDQRRVGHDAGGGHDAQWRGGRLGHLLQIVGLSCTTLDNCFHDACEVRRVFLALVAIVPCCDYAESLPPNTVHTGMQHKAKGFAGLVQFAVQPYGD